MQDPNPKKNLSEISHLFLSGIREKQAGQSASGRPQRIGPHQRVSQPKPNVSVDLTPEEFAQVIGEGENASPRDLLSPHVAPVSALIGSHLNGKQFDRVKEYARHLSAGGARIGLIEIDASEFRLMCFDRQGNADSAEIPAAETFDPRQMAEAIEELNWDVQRWLLMVPNPRTPEARALLRETHHWVLLTTCDHDGVVSCYRTLKGLADLHRPRLSLALLDARDQVTAGRVYRKISTVCQQFLNWPIESDGIVQAHPEVSGHLLMFCRPVHDKAQLAGAPQWQIVADFLAKSNASQSPLPMAEPVQTDVSVSHDESMDAMESAPAHIADIVIPMEEPQPTLSDPMPIMPTPSSISDDSNEVIDLPDSAGNEQSILSAVLKRNHEFIETPIKAPMCPAAVLTVSRDRKLVMHVVSHSGLSDLRSIGMAYRWLMENRGLVAMALPQFAIDAHALPGLQLLVDHADLSADLLQPLMQSSQVKVQSYRKLKWGGKTGLLLEAA